MNILILPSLVAIGIKIWLFSVSRWLLFRDNPYLAFLLCALFGLNLTELILFSVINDTDGALPVMMAYYVTTVFSVTAYLMFVINVVKSAKSVTKYLLIAAFIVSILVCIPDFFISGTHSIGYSLTRTPGEHYGWLQAYLLISMCSAIVICAYGAISSKDRLVRKRSLVVLMATAPMALMAISIITVMIMGYKLNATVILSLMTSVTLMMLIYAEKRYRLFKFLSYLPYTQEYKLRKQINILISDMIKTLFQKDKKPDFKEIIAKFESSVIEIAIVAANGNKTHAAQLLQIGKATLHRKIAKK